MVEQQQRAVYRDMMTRFLGPVIMTAIDDPAVTEIYTNPHDQRIWVIRHAEGRLDTGVRIDPSSVLSFLNTVATSLRTTIGPDCPDLQAELPLGRHRKPRLQGLVPPLVEAPCVVIRKHAPQVISLERMQRQGVLSPYFADVLRHAVSEHWNVLVVGGPRTGKTTLANAVLGEIAHQFPDERIVLIEDTIELQCESEDHLSLRVREGESMAEPVKRVLRLSPDRIVVGEVRDQAAFYMLDAWLTGSPGSVATLHGSSPENALLRLDLLCQRANVPTQVQLIAAAVQLIVELRREEGGTRVVEVASVEGLDASGHFVLSRFDPSGRKIEPSRSGAEGVPTVGSPGSNGQSRPNS